MKGSASVNRLFVWTGVYDPAYTGATVEWLIPRLQMVDRRTIRFSTKRWLSKWQDRFHRRVRRPLLYRMTLPALARRYKGLLTTDLLQVPFFTGPVVLDYDDPYFSAHEVETMNLPNVKAVVIKSDLIADRFRQLGVRNPIVVSPFGVQLDTLDSGEAQVLRRRHQAQAGEIVVGCTMPYMWLGSEAVGEWGKQQDVGFLFESFELARAIEPQLVLWLVGRPSPNVRKHAAERNYVRLVGFFPMRQILDVIAAFDIAVYPRRHDRHGRFSQKLIEYMACGKPIVSTDISHSWVLQESGAGLITKDADEFAQAIVRLARDEGLRRELGEKGARYAAAHDWDLIAKLYEEHILTPVLAGKRPAPRLDVFSQQALRRDSRSG